MDRRELQVCRDFPPLPVDAALQNTAAAWLEPQNIPTFPQLSEI